MGRDQLRRQGQPAPGPAARSRCAARDGRVRPLDRHHRLPAVGGQGHRRPPDRRDRELLRRVRRGPFRDRGRRRAGPEGHAGRPRRGRQGVPRPGPGRGGRQAPLGLREDDGDLRGADRRRVGRADGRAQVHGAAAYLHLPGVPAHGLRRARLGHPPGHRPGARAERRHRGPAGAADVHLVAGHHGDPAGPGAVLGRHPRVGAQRRGLPGQHQRGGPELRSGGHLGLAGRARVRRGEPGADQFGRVNAGTIRGDRTVADQFLNSFFRI